MDKVWFLKPLREAHIWERVTLGAQVEGSDGGDGVGEGEGEGVTGEPTQVGAKEYQSSAIDRLTCTVIMFYLINTLRDTLKSKPATMVW